MPSGCHDAAEIFGKGGDLLSAGRPGAHEAAVAGADEGVEDPAVPAQGGDGVFRQLYEDRVGFDRVDQGDAGDGGQCRGQLPGTGVGMGGIVQQGAVPEQAEPRRGEKA